MKRSFLFILGILLSFSAGMVLRTEAYVSDEDLLEELFAAAGISGEFENDAKELEQLAADSDLPFGNLYLFMFQNVMNGPQEATLESLAGRWLGVGGKVTYSKEELEDIVLNGNTELILQKHEEQAAEASSPETVEEADAQYEEFISNNDLSDTSEGYLRWKYEQSIQPQASASEDLATAATLEGVLAEYTYLKDLYNQEFEFQMENRKLAYEALANEIFLNNDLGDSAGIDLLYDFDLIHYLLFGEYITYPDRSSSGVELSSVELASSEFTSNELETFEDQAVILAASTESIDPYTCYADDAITEALETYEENPPETGDVEIPSSPINYEIEVGVEGEEGESETGAGAETGAGETGEEDGGVNVIEKLQEFDDFISSLEGEIGDWSRSLPCNDIFCIEINLVSDRDEPRVEYEKTENCIACHVAYIRQRMEETTGRSLVPSKISMNYFEDATCKEAGNFVNLDLNVYAIPKPIDLDKGDEIDETAEWDIEAFKTRLWGIAGFPLPGETKTILGKTLADMECESRENLIGISGIDQSLEELLADCLAQSEASKNEVAEAYEEFLFDSVAENTNTLYSQVSAELYTMLLYFESFQKGLKDTYASEEAPLTQLLTTKKYCE